MSAFADLVDRGRFKRIRRFLFNVWWDGMGIALKAGSRAHDAGWKLRYKVANLIIGKHPGEDDE